GWGQAAGRGAWGRFLAAVPGGGTAGWWRRARLGDVPRSRLESPVAFRVTEGTSHARLRTGPGPVRRPRATAGDVSQSPPAGGVRTRRASGQGTTVHLRQLRRPGSSPSGCAGS